MAPISAKAKAQAPVAEKAKAPIATKAPISAKFKAIKAANKKKKEAYKVAKAAAKAKLPVQKKPFTQKDPAIKAAKQAAAKKKHAKRVASAAKTGKKVPKFVVKTIPAKPRRTEPKTRTKAKKQTTSLKSKIDDVKKNIKLIKRAGGTLRFAKELKRIRNVKKSLAVGQEKKAAKLRATYAKRDAIAAAKAAVKGKTDKDGKPLRPKRVHLRDTYRFKICKMRRIYHTQLPMRTLPSKNLFKDMHPEKRRHLARLRPTLKPGTVCIIVAGKKQCKKVVFLKQLKKSGLCLVTGPWSINRVPLRRMHQNFMIATSVRIDLGKKFKVPPVVNDSYFKKPRVVKKIVSKAEDAFKMHKVTLKKKPDKTRKVIQTFVDKHVRKGIRKHEDAAAVKKYLKSDFSLRGTRYPHLLKF